MYRAVFTMFYSTLMVAFRDLQVMINPLALTLLTKKRRMGDDGLLFANKNLSGLSQEVTLIIILIILQSCWTRVDQTFAKCHSWSYIFLLFPNIQYYSGLIFFQLFYETLEETNWSNEKNLANSSWNNTSSFD